MATDVTAMRQQSAASSIQFIQDDHARTLQGLHSEIQRLQKRCSDLTFELAMETTSSSQEEFYRSKCSELEAAMVRLEHVSREQLAMTAERDKKVATLEQQLRAQESKYKTDLKVQGKSLMQLRADLDSKGGTIAYLTTQLHALRTQRTDLRQPTPPSPRPPTSHESPRPPTVSSRHRRRSGCSLRHLVEDEPLTQRRLSVDTSPFVDRSSTVITCRAPHTPLPPIATIDNQRTDLRPHAIRRGAMRKPPTVTMSTTTSPERETIAVVTVEHQHDRRHVQPSQSSD